MVKKRTRIRSNQRRDTVLKLRVTYLLAFIASFRAIAQTYLQRYRILFLFCLILAIGMFFRLYHITTIPFGLNNDAAWEGSAALDILHGNITTYLPYAAEGWRGEPIIRLVVAGFMLIIGNNRFAIPLASDIFGIELIVMTFFFIRLLFGWQKALLTSFFIAISGWAITMSKSGWRAVTVPFFSVTFFYLFFFGMKEKKYRYFIFAGIILSIGSFYTYDAGRMLLFFFMFCLCMFVIMRRKVMFAYWKHLVALILSCLVCSLPMIMYAFGNWTNFTGRSNFLFIGPQIQKAHSLRPLWDNSVTTIELFSVKGNGNDFFITQPLLEKPEQVLFIVGFIIVVAKILKDKDTSFVFILAFFFAFLIPGILSMPNGNRAIGVIPAVYFFCSVGLLGSARVFRRIIPRWKFLGTGAFVVIISFSCMWVTYRDYLGPHRIELPGFYPETLITTNYIKTIWKTYDIYLTDNYPQELLTYYLYRTDKPAFYKNYTWVEKSSDFLHLAKTKKNTAKGKAFFMFAADYNSQTIAQLVKQNPTAKTFYLWYDNGTIHRPASFVILIPAT